ncbi:MAG: PLP-dependent aminotransferase family protein [Albidovulum sp.]
MDEIWLPDLAQFDGPKYQALARALREAIRSGALESGARLPPVRELSWALSITPGTVSRAYQIATQEGLLEATVGRGTFVASKPMRLGLLPLTLSENDENFPPIKNAGSVDLRSPQLPEVGQGAAMSAVLAQMVGRIGQEDLEYPGLRRDIPLRQAMADWLSLRELGPYGADDIALTLGGQNGIGITLQCCLRGDRPHIYCEELAYPGFRRAVRLNRGEVVPVMLDAEGMLPEALDAACRRYGGRVVCVTPEAQNPTTARMSLERRQAIVEVAVHHDLQIIEDECYSVAESALPSLRALAPDRVWHISSISKSLSAGLRFGAIVAPTGLGEAARLAAQHNYFSLPRLVTDVVLSLLRSGEAHKLRSKVQAVIERRLELTLNILGRHDLRWQRGLSFVWLPMPSGWRASTFIREAESLGVLVRSADEYALVDGRAPSAVRIALACGIPEAQFTDALARLAGLLDAPRGDLAV